MSHELRTPLNATIGFSDVIFGKMFGPISDDKYVDYAEDINNSGKALLGHVDDILDLSKIEAGKSELSEVTVDVAWIVEICIAELREQAEAGGIEIEREISAELPGLIADEHKCKQILFNLVSNAVKFTPSGGRAGYGQGLAAPGQRICFSDRRYRHRHRAAGHSENPRPLPPGRRQPQPQL